MTIRYHLPTVSAATARGILGDRPCRVTPVRFLKSSDVEFFTEADAAAFRSFANRLGLAYQPVSRRDEPATDPETW